LETLEPSTRYARSADVNIAYQVVGDGPLDLVLVPDWVSQVAAMWEEPTHEAFLRRLASFSRLILFDNAALDCRIGSAWTGCPLWTTEWRLP
jgi:hypothetical protein